MTLFNSYLRSSGLHRPLQYLERARHVFFKFHLYSGLRAKHVPRRSLIELVHFRVLHVLAMGSEKMRDSNDTSFKAMGRQHRLDCKNGKTRNTILQ